MALIQRGDIWWYRFRFAGRYIQESTKQTSKTVARTIEENKKRELRDSVTGVETKTERSRTIRDAADAHLEEANLRRPKSTVFRTYALRHVCDLLGKKFVPQIDMASVTKYQLDRQKEGASGKTINGEVVLLLRIMEKRGDAIREELKRKKLLALPVNDNVGKAYSSTEQARLLEAAKDSRSRQLHFALHLLLNGAMRDTEVKTLRWSQIDLAKNTITVGDAKSKESTGRIVPLNGKLRDAFTEHVAWYKKCFGEKLHSHWFVFPFGRRGALDPTKHVTTFKTAWQNAREKAGVKGRWHDTRHTVVTMLLESGASSTTVKSIAGHVSNRMMERYSHANMDAKRIAMERMDKYREEMLQLETEALKKGAHDHHLTVVA